MWFTILDNDVYIGLKHIAISSKSTIYPILSNWDNQIHNVRYYKYRIFIRYINNLEWLFYYYSY